MTRPKLQADLATEASLLIKKEAFWDSKIAPNGFYFLIHREDDVFYILEILVSDGFDAWYNGCGRLIINLKPVITHYTK